MSDEADSTTFSTLFRKGRILKRNIRKQENGAVSELDTDNDLQDPNNDLLIQNKKYRMNQICTTKKCSKEIDLSCNGLNEFDTISGFNIEEKFNSSKNTELEGLRDMGATARSEIDTEYSKDAQAQFERIQQLLKADENTSLSSSKCYGGMAMYGAKKKSDTVKGSASSGLNRIGPMRASQYMRSSVRWDYAPDICKDYKETGFCTFGDSCKFMHDRSDYKHGWQLEKEWEQGKLEKSNDNEYLIDSEDELNETNLPTCCFICHNSFNNPVVTKCKHYFCEACVLERCKKTKKCAVCGYNTEGQFKFSKV